MKKIVALLAILSVTIPGMTQAIPISDAKAAGLNTSPTVSGVVLNGAELGVIRYIQDATGGLALYDGTTLANVLRGDSITVTGKLVDYYGLMEMQPVNSMIPHSTGAKLPDPLVLTPSQMSEQYEGMLIRIDDAEFELAGKEFEPKTNYFFTAGGETGQLRINDAASPFIGKVIPSGEVVLTGIEAQFNDFYQLMVRDLDDIRAPGSIHFTSSPVMKDLTTSGFTIEWNTDSAGSTEMFYGNTPELELGKLSVPGNSTEHSITISDADPSTLFYVKPFSVRGQDTANVIVQVYVTRSVSSGEMIAYFNRSVDHSVSLGTDAVVLDRAIDDTLISYINRAEESIDFTIYNFNNEGISNISTALNNAHARGVVVRVIYDGVAVNKGIDELSNEIGRIAGPTEGYPNYGIMHNKFVVFDAMSADPEKSIVWTGATNFTDTQINFDPNNVIIIKDKSLALAYRIEFNEMYGTDAAQPDHGESRFGPDKLDNTPHEFIIGGKRVELYFSPSDQTHKKILSTIESADKELFAGTMLITKTDIGYAISDKFEAGVRAEVLVKDEESCNETVVSTLRNSLAENFKVSGDGGIYHHKTLIVDQSDPDSDPILLTGCHNWSTSAQFRNDENTLIIHDQTMANIYYQEFVERFRNGILLVDAPECNPEFVEMKSGSFFRYDVLYNDEIPGPVNVTINKQPTNGSAVVETDLQVTYRPDAGFNQNIDTVFYKVCMQSNGNICDSSMMVIYVNLPVSTSDLTADESISLFPNPTSGLLSISSNEKFNPVRLHVTDLTGRHILSDSGIEGSGGNYSIDLGRLQKGYYYIILENREGDRQIQSVVLQ